MSATPLAALDGRDRGQRLFVLLAATTCGAIFWVVGYRILSFVHPAEDAYILFRYAEHIAEGLGIVFNPSGPRAEGATDFLWLLLLSAGVRVGIDVALAALALNALGAALAGGLLARLCWNGPARSGWVRAALCVVLSTTFLTGGALAGYWGFSAMFYSALVLLLFAVASEWPDRATVAVPVLALTIGLMRPDGVIMGVAFTALGLWPAWSKGRLGRYLSVSAACAVFGALYFVWRWRYFGLPLPLPLYVKQGASTAVGGWRAVLPGMAFNEEWFLDPTGPRFIVLGLLAVLAWVRPWRDETGRRLLVFLIPLGALLAVLSFAVQTQNVDLRFQAPVFLVLVYSLLAFAGRIIDGPGPAPVRWLMILLVVAAVTPSIAGGFSNVDVHLRGRWRTYLEAFAPRFGPLLPKDSVIALTEAGALPYWTEAEVVDVVGLNHPAAAVRPMTIADLDAIDPDMVFLHQGGSLMNDVLIPPGTIEGRIHRVSSERLGRALLPSRREIVERQVSSYRDTGLMNVQFAPAVMIEFLSRRSDYDILVVDPTGSRTYRHVYGLKRDWPLYDEAVEALHWAADEGHYVPYLELLRTRGKHRTR